MFNLFSNNSVQSSSVYYTALKAYQLDPNEHFASVKRRHGLDVAELYAHQYFQNQKPYQRFRREIDLHPGEYNQLNKQFDVIIVAPPATFFPAEQSKSLLRPLLSLATGAGFRQVMQVTPEVSNALEGARRLRKVLQLRLQSGRPFILVSFSFGSAYVRICMDHMQADELRGVKGWLNISGLIHGTPRFHCSNKFSLFQPMGRDRRSFSCEQRYFRSKPETQSVKVIHWLGLKPASHRSERRERDYLKAWGPNDGLLPWADYQNVSGPVVPFVNQGHFFNMSDVGSLYLRSLSSMVSTLPQQKPLKASSALNFTQVETKSP